MIYISIVVLITAFAENDKTPSFNKCLNAWGRKRDTKIQEMLIMELIKIRFKSAPGENSQSAKWVKIEFLPIKNSKSFFFIAINKNQFLSI